MTKIAVTGASGHVGSCLVRYLISEGYNVKVLIHKNEKGLQGLKIQKIKGDVCDKESLKELAQGTDTVFHLAAVITLNGIDKENVIKTNIEGTKNILDAAIENGVSRFIHFSTIHALETEPANEPMDETRPLIKHSKMIYELTKAEGELLIEKASKSGLQTITLNPTSIIGPYDFKPSIQGSALIKIARNKLPGLVDGGYDWVDVRDVAKAAVAAITKGKNGERYILSGKWYSLLQISKMISEITGKKTPTKIIPASIAKAGVPFIKLYSKLSGKEPLFTYNSLNIVKNSNRNISNEKARKELGFTVRPIKTTLEDTIDWFVKNKYLKL